MATKTIPSTTSADNIELLNAMIKSNGLYERYGVANLQNMAQIGESLISDSMGVNIAIPSLLNRLGLVKFKHATWNNILAEQKKGLMEFGETIEQVHTNLCKEHGYNQDNAERTLFKRELPDTNVIFHTLNRKGYYVQTVERQALKQAFLNPNGLDELVNSIMGVMTTSDNFDEYTYMKNLLSNYVQKEYSYDVKLDPIIDKESAENALVQLRAYALKLGFVSNKYNQFGVDTFTKMEDIFIYIKPEVSAYIDVKALAKAFNIEYTNFMGHVIVVDDFGVYDDGNTQLMMVDREFMQVYDNHIGTESIYNQQSLSWNYFLHHWQVLSSSRFANCIRFTTSEVTTLKQPTIKTIVLDKESSSIAKGQDDKITATVTAENDAPTTVIYKMVGNSSRDTFVDSEGFIKIGKDERSSTVKVTAISSFDTSKIAECAVTITE